MNTGMSTGMAPVRKVRGDAKLAQLTPPQRELLRVWLEEDNETYASVVRMIYHQFGVNVSKSAVGAYYKRHLLPDRYDDDNEAAAFLAALPEGQFDAAIVRHAKALAFNALAHPVPQIQTASRLLDLVHRVQRQEIAEKRLALEHRRVALKEADLASRPPRAQPRHSPPGDGGHPRSATAERRSLPVREPRPALPAPPLDTHRTPPNLPRFPAYSQISQPPEQPQVHAPQSSLAYPDSAFPASVTSEPSPFLHATDPAPCP